MANQILEIAKEITLAAIEKGLIIVPTKGAGYNETELSDYNQMRVKEIGKFYKSITKSVNDALNGKFNFDDE